MGRIVLRLAPIPRNRPQEAVPRSLAVGDLLPANAWLSPPALSLPQG